MRLGTARSLTVWAAVRTARHRGNDEESRRHRRKDPLAGTGLSAEQNGNITDFLSAQAAVKPRDGSIVIGVAAAYTRTTITTETGRKPRGAARDQN